jgi:hypothetical protein
MNIYKDLEDSLYNVIEELFPATRIIFAYNNLPEPQTPYLVIDVKRLDQLGSEYNSTFVESFETTPTTTTQIDMMAKVRFEVVGLMDNDTEAAELAQNIQFALRTARGYESQARNNLARHGQITTRRMPYRKDTDMYMLYQVDANFAYTAISQDEQDYILTTDFTGIYHDANRPPDYTLTTHVDINPTP